MQPLSYQTLPISCWPTSMLNGILLLKKNNKGIAFQAYRRLHDLLGKHGVTYYTPKELEQLRAVLDDVEAYCKLKIRLYRVSKVEPALRRLHFRDQVAVCDIHGGYHSILLHGREKDYFLAFDPQWKNVRKPQDLPAAYKTQPESPNPRTVNVKIHREYLMRRYGEREFQLGRGYRFLTVMENA